MVGSRMKVAEAWSFATAEISRKEMSRAVVQKSVIWCFVRMMSM